jgi:hypothetical protein
MPAYIRSALTTFLATFLGLIPVAAVVDGDFTWASAAITAAVIAAVRTGIAALDPGQPLYGIGSDAPEGD